MQINNINIKEQLIHAVECLTVMTPICKRAGIVTQSETSYDEWEELVQAVFKSFIVLPICDTDGIYSPSQFHRMGFTLVENEIVVKIKIENENYYLFDIVNRNELQIELELKPCLDKLSKRSIFLTIETLSRLENSLNIIEINS